MVVLVAFVSFQIANRKILEMARLQSENNVQYAVSSIDDYYSQIERWTTNILRIPTLQDVASKETLPESALHNYSLMLLINTLSQAEEGGIVFPLAGLYLRNGDNYLVGSNREYPFQNYQECIQYFECSGANFNTSYTPGSFYICDISNTISQTVEKRLVYLRFLYERSTMKKLGILVVEISNDKLLGLYDYISRDSIIMDHKGIVLSSQDTGHIGHLYGNTPIRDYLQTKKSDFGTVSLENEKDWRNPIIFSYRLVLGNNAYLVAPFDYYSSLNETEVYGFIRSVLILVLVSSLIAIVFSSFIAGRLSASVQDLTGFVKQVYNGNSGERYTPRTRDEVAYLGEKINDMLDRIEKAAKDRELDLRNQQIMELRLMQSQINPHLLYNTLDSVLWAIQNDNMENATELIASLSGFFRLALSRGVERITLERELQLIETYVNIQRLARNQNVTLIKTIPEELLDHSIIKLTLQPLVENAYLHGFAGYRDDGTLTIRAVHDDKTLILTVEDNGIGMLNEEVEQINKNLRTNSLPQKTHSVGIYNVNRRIMHEYGNEYGVTIQSSVSEYTIVTVTIPYISTKESSES